MPARGVIVRRVGGEIEWIAAVAFHYVNIKLAISIGSKGDGIAIRRPGRILILVRILAPVGDLASIDVHGVDLVMAISIRSEGDQYAAWLPRGRKIIGLGTITQIPLL